MSLQLDQFLSLSQRFSEHSYQPTMLIAPRRVISRMHRALKRWELQARGRHYLRRLANGKPPKKRRH